MSFEVVPIIGSNYSNKVSNEKDCLEEYFSLILQLWRIFLELVDNSRNNW